MTGRAEAAAGSLAQLSGSSITTRSPNICAAARNTSSRYHRMIA
jgi:hypothetical protein